MADRRPAHRIHLVTHRAAGGGVAGGDQEPPRQRPRRGDHRHPSGPAPAAHRRESRRQDAAGLHLHAAGRAVGGSAALALAADGLGASAILPLAAPAVHRGAGQRLGAHSPGVQRATSATGEDRGGTVPPAPTAAASGLSTPRCLRGGPLCRAGDDNVCAAGLAAVSSFKETGRIDVERLRTMPVGPLLPRFEGRRLMLAVDVASLHREMVLMVRRRTVLLVESSDRRWITPGLLPRGPQAGHAHVHRGRQAAQYPVDDASDLN